MTTPLAIHLATALRRQWRLHAEWRWHRRAMAEMQVLSDRLLKDIGVCRGEIYWVTHYGRYAPRERRPVRAPFASSRRAASLNAS